MESYQAEVSQSGAKPFHILGHRLINTTQSLNISI